MKKLFKLFPLALAALTFASCSDDLNIANGEKELAYSPDKLLVQIEDDGSSDVTRGGYVTNIYNYNLYSALAFDAGETLKLYHDATSWRPEIWTATKYDQYKNVVGTTAFAKEGATITKEENAYGIYPSTASVFGNEDRTSIQYDLSDLAFVDYSIDATKTYAGTTGEGAITKYYKAEFPLWGVKEANAEVMTMKHLAGILRLDIADITNNGAFPLPTADGQYRYVIVRSAAKKLTGVIKTAGELLNPTALEELDPTTFMTTTPRLEVENAVHVAALTATPITAATAAAADNVIVIRIDKNTTDKHVMAYFPILPQMVGGDVDIYVTPNITPGANTTIDLGDAANIAFQYALTADVITECNNAYQPSTKPYAGLNTVQRGVTYKINDDRTNVNTTAKTPFELAKGIIAADKVAYRDFEVTFTQPINVKNNDASPQNFYVDLTNSVTDYLMTDYPDGWDLKHNVTVNLTLQESSDAGTVPSVLYIKTKEGSKKLTLNIKKGATAVDSIVFKKGELKSELVMKYQYAGVGDKLPNIHVGEGNNDKLTINAGANKVIANSNLTISTLQNANDNIDVLTFAKGVEKVSIKGGRVSTVNLSATEKIAGDVTLYTEGTVGVNAVNYANMPTTGTGATTADQYNIIYDSKFTGTVSAIFPTTTVNGQANSIITASQLAAAATGTNYNVVGTFNLSGDEDVVWTSLAAQTNSFKGAKFIRIDANAVGLSGVATIKNLKGANGLIAKWTPAADTEISNITFDGGSAVKGAAAASAIGLLVGEVDNQTSAGVIKNITVQGTNTIEGQTTGAGIGGVIGKISDATNALTLANIKVASADTKVKGFKYVGGIVGEVAGKVIFAAQKADGTALKTSAAADFAANDVYNSSAATLETYRISTTAPASENLPTKGQFFGGASVLATAGDVTILGALTKVSAGITDPTWGYYLTDVNHESWVWPATLYYNEIGLCGYDVDGSYATGFSVVKKAAFAAIVNLTENTATHKYATSTNLVPSVAKTAPVDGTPANTKYFSWVKNPQE